MSVKSAVWGTPTGRLTRCQANLTPAWTGAARRTELCASVHSPTFLYRVMLTARGFNAIHTLAIARWGEQLCIYKSNRLSH